MKRAKKLVTLFTVAAMALSSVVTVFGADDLSYTEKAFYSEAGVMLGKYPVVKGMDSVNKEIYNYVLKSYEKYSWEQSDASGSNLFQVVNTVENDDQFAIVTVTLKFKNVSVQSLNNGKAVEPLEIYIDKDGEYKKLDNKAAYEKAKADLEAAAAAAEEEELLDEEELDEEEADEETTEDAVDEEASEDVSADAEEEDVVEEAAIVYVGLKANVVAQGYVISAWDSKTQTATIALDGEDVAFVTNGNNVCVINGEEVELDGTPYIDADGSLQVPVSFFEALLGSEVTVDNDGLVAVVEAAEDEE